MACSLVARYCVLSECSFSPRAGYNFEYVRVERDFAYAAFIRAALWRFDPSTEAIFSDNFATENT
jgi:hypothetical protein